MSTRIDAAPRLLRRGAVAASALALAWLLAGCTSGASDSGGEASAGADMAYSEADAAQEDADRAASGADEDGADDGRAVIVTGSLYITVMDPIVAATDATEIVEAAGGRIDARAETAATEYDGGAAWLTLRIPSDKLDPTVEKLRTLGTVDEYSTSSADVTREVTDLDAQISTLRASTTRIEGLLTDAQDIKDIITLEDELASRQAQLESLEARQRGLDDQVSMSTIELSLSTEPVVYVDSTPRSFWSGLASGWDALVGFLTGTLVVVGVLLPWIALVALVGAAVLVAVRGARARRRSGASSPAGASSPEEPEPSRD